MKRKNLLITSIGALNSISSWLCTDRTFDIALIYYPDEITPETKSKLETYADYLFFESGFKYEILQRIFLANPELMEYEYFWMPDDDVTLINGTTNELFDYARKYQLNLCQPSTTRPNTSWKILRHRKSCELRYTNFVEVMCPLFSKKGLTLTLDSFTLNKSGWGMEFFWASVIKEPIAVIDRILVAHTKKIQIGEGALYKKLLEETGKSPFEERDEIIKKYNLTPVPVEYSRIYREGTLREYIYRVFFKRSLVVKRTK